MYIIEMKGITKKFPGIIANDNITLQLKKGEIHALLGENGAGKSTLMSILFGLYKPDEGTIYKNGEQVDITGPNDATKLGIGMVHQHFKLVHNFTVLENIILGVETTKNGVLRTHEARDKVIKLSEKYGLSIELDKEIQDITGQDKLYFYDAAAPIVAKDSIDFSVAFYGDRYTQEKKKDETIEEWKIRLEQEEKSYINLPMNQEEYETFYKNLIEAEVVNPHEFEKKEIFEGCMPVEIMAKRGVDTLRFGPLKPVGFDDPRTGRRPYAIVQLRQDNRQATIYNIVGFQTNLKFREQQRVFSMLPGLEKAEFVKYGVMHRNTYINSSKLLEETYQLKKNRNIYFAGQIAGVEGYVESISSGMVVALNAINQFKNLGKVTFPEYTMIGALSKYISIENINFQPMNANF